MIPSLNFAGTIHSAYGNLEYSNHSIPSSVSFTAYITTRPAEILHEYSVGCGYETSSGQWYVQCGNFPTNWSAGETLHIDFNDGVEGTGSDEIVLTNNSIDNGGMTTLLHPNRQITITTNPPGFSIIADGSSYTAPHIFTWEQTTSHTISVNSPQNESGGQRDVFSNWSDGEDQTHAYIVPGSDATVTATFSRQYLLTIVTDHGDPQGAGWYDDNVMAPFSLTTPDVQGMTRYLFDHWSGNLSHSDPLGTIRMDGPKTITASWNTQYYLEINSRHGYVSGEGWKDEGASAHFYVTTQEISGGSGIKYVFTGWTSEDPGSYTGAATSHIVTMNNPITETVLWKTQYFLSTAVDPLDAGHVTVDDTDSWCDSASIVTVTASANSNYGFVWWEGSLSGDSNPSPILMNSPKSVTAKFGKRVQIAINTGIAGRSFNVDGTYYNSPQIFTWTQYKTHSLSINSPQSGGSGEQFVFTSWSHGMEQNHIYTVPGSNQTLTANFKRQYYLTVNSAYGNPQGAGWWDANANAYFSVGSPYLQGDTRYVFLEWSGDYTGTSPSGSIYMNGVKSVTASWQTQYYLEIVSSYGSPTGQDWYDAGDPATFGITTPVSGGTGKRHVFIRWSGTGTGSYSGSNETHTVTMNNPIHESATWKTQFYLNTAESPPDYGNIYPSPPGTWCDSSTIQSISAVPESGYNLARWDGDLEGTDNPTSLFINGTKNVTAVFGKLVQITVATSPAGQIYFVDGNFENSTKNFDWVENSKHMLSTQEQQYGETGVRYIFLNWSNSMPRSHTYTVPAYDQIVTANFKTQYELTINSDVGDPTPSEPTWYNEGEYAYFSVKSSETTEDTRYDFWQWTGDYSGIDTSGFVKMTSPKNITALWKHQYKLAINSLYGEIQMESDGWYNENDTAYFSITSQEINGTTRHMFTEWTGDYSGTDTSGVIIMDGPKYMTANWETEYYLSIEENPEEGGEVIPPPPGQWCAEGSEIQLRAIPNREENFTFGGWTGDKTDMDSLITIVMDNSKSMTANFIYIGKIRITTSPSGLNIIVDDTLRTAPADFNWSSGSSHTIGTFSPQNELNGLRYVFDSWSDSKAMTHGITIDGISIYMAEFVKQYQLTVQSDPYEGGIVNTLPDTSWIDAGTTVVFQAVPDTSGGFMFWKWSGGLTGTHNPDSIKVNASKQVIAHFISKTCSLTVDIHPPGAGTVSYNPAKTIYDRGEFVQITATPAETFLFKDWTGDTVTANNPITIQMNADKKIIANFMDEDSSSPVLTGCYPPHGAEVVPRNSFIQFTVIDANEGTGVDRSSINVSVNNVNIISNGTVQGELAVEIKSRTSGYQIQYRPANDFPEESLVAVHVQCQDISSAKNALDSTYTFKTGQSPVVFTLEKVVGQTGGTITDALTGIEMVIPTGAVEGTTHITIGYYQNPPPLPDSVRYVDMAYHFGPEGFQFADSVLLRIPYTNSDLVNAAVTDPYDLPIYYYSTISGQWVLLTVIYATGSYVEVQVKEFCYLLFGKSYSVSVDRERGNLPRSYALKQNYPNPFNPVTTIEYDIPKSGQVSIVLFNVIGQKVNTLVHEFKPAGTYRVNWDGKNDQGEKVNSGLYFYLMRSGSFEKKMKCVLLK